MSFNVPDFIKFMVFILVVLVASPPCLYDGEKEYMLQVVLCGPIECTGDTFHQHVCHFTCNDKLWRIWVGHAAGLLPLFSQRWNVPYPNTVQYLLQTRGPFDLAWESLYRPFVANGFMTDFGYSGLQQYNCFIYNQWRYFLIDG